jgi:hypothetical protein
MYIIVAGFSNFGIKSDNTLSVKREEELEGWAETLAPKFPGEDISIFRLEKKWITKTVTTYKKFIITDKNEVLPE